MSKSKNERLSSNGKLKNLSTEENKGLYGYISPINDGIMNPAPYYWNTPMSYVPYPSYPNYNSPYDYQPIPSQYAAAPQPPTTPVSKKPLNKQKEPLPSAPKGRVPLEYNPANASFPLTQYAPPIVYNPIQPQAVPPVPIQYVQPPAPQPQYYYPQASSSFYYPPPPSPYHYDRRRSPPPYYRDRYVLPPYVLFLF